MDSAPDYYNPVSKFKEPSISLISTLLSGRNYAEKVPLVSLSSLQRSMDLATTAEGLHDREAPEPRDWWCEHRIVGQ